MPSPRVIVFGYDELVLDSVAVVEKGGGELAAVVFPCTRTDAGARRLRSRMTQKEKHILEQPRRKALSAFVEKMRDLNPDLILVWSYPMTLPPSLLALPRLGCINVHMGSLPEYRGANGLRWAIRNGEQETGVTLHYMEAELDVGPMLARAKFPIAAGDNLLTVLRKARHAGLQLLRAGWPHFSKRKLPAQPQDESRARYYPQWREEDGLIHWNESAGTLRNLVRASPEPFSGAYTWWHQHKLIVRKAAQITKQGNDPPGTIQTIGPEGLAVVTGKGSLLLQQVEWNGQILEAPDLSRLGCQAGDSLAH